MNISSQSIKMHIASHLVNRSSWLRAAVLGANDGVLSIASILTGMAAANTPHHTIVLAGLAGLVAGATSMATGEYVSVSSQSDIEKADLRLEKYSLSHNAKYEHEELAQIYVERGLEASLAKKVANQLMAHDALGAHARDELGMSEMNAARPIQAALASAASFSVGAALPLSVVAVSPSEWIIASVTTASLISLAVLGALGAKTSGVAVGKPMLRVLLWGSFSMGLTAYIGSLFGISA
jgi:VIT1/CCC1 family predicted Fe2+/Mn2+ transporter